MMVKEELKGDANEERSVAEKVRQSLIINSMKAYKLMRIRAKIGLSCLVKRTFFSELILKQILVTDGLFNGKSLEELE